MSETSNALTNAYKFNKTFSGTDTLAFLMLPGCTPVWIGALTTVSYSMFRNKKPVINIGRTNINGVTRGSRIFAGTMIFTLINQHWLRELCEQPEVNAWLGNYNELKADELPLFDIMIISANEYGNWCEMFIFGIDVTDEAQTISVEDLFTENTLSFVARDVSTFQMVDPIKGKVESQDNGGNSQQKPVTEIIDIENPSIEDIDKIEQELKNNNQPENVVQEDKSTPNHLSRNLYYSSSDTIIGNDVSALQNKLNQLGYDLEINGKFDDIMDDAIKKYQSEKGLSEINGVVDNTLYSMILEDTIGEEDGRHMACVVNKNGASVYREVSMNSDIIDVIPYNEIVQVFEIIVNQDDNGFSRFYKTESGYVLESDMYSFLSAGSVIEFPKIKYGDSNSFVTMIQQTLQNLYPNGNIQITGEYSDADIELIKKIQKENGLKDTGEVDTETWKVLYSLDASIIESQSKDNYSVKPQTKPGTSYGKFQEVMHDIDKFDCTLYSDVDLNVKTSAVTEYEDGQTLVYSNMQTIHPIAKSSNVISFKSLQKAFLYHPEHGVPVKTELVLHPYNKKTLKWTINFIKEGGM